MIEELVVSTEGKTSCKRWNSDNWGGCERILSPEILHYIGKNKTQRLERTNGIVRQQTGRWHRRQNKFSKLWEQTKVTTRLVVSYFNWIWRHSRLKTTAAQRAELTFKPWTWHNIVTYPTILWCTTKLSVRFKLEVSNLEARLCFLAQTIHYTFTPNKKRQNCIQTKR